MNVNQHFDYDSETPLNLRERRRFAVDGVACDEVSFDSPLEGRVAATILCGAPTSTARPVIVMLHWGFGRRTSFLTEGLAYARSGARVMLVDAPFMGDRGRGLPRLDRAEVALRYLRHSVLDLRRSLDVLVARETDVARLCYVGHSLGATVGVPFVAADARVCGAVLLAGTGDLSRGVWLLSPDAAYREAMAPFDGNRVVAQVRADLLFQFGTRDAFIDRGTAERLIAAAPQARTVWYDADHGLSHHALADRAAWLCPA